MGRAVIAPSPGGPDRPARPAARGLALSHSPSTRTRRPWRRGLFFSDFPFCTRHSGVKDCAVPPCVDGPWNARLLYRWDRSGSVMCPAFYRGIVATGPDEVRGWRANQFVELKALGEPRLCSIPGPTGSPSLLSPSFLRSTIAEPDSFKRLRAGKSPLFSEEPTRRGRSCLRSLPTPCVPVCAARASRSIGMMGHQCAPFV